MAVVSVFSKYYIPNTIIAHEQWMRDFHLKARDTENVVITIFLAVVAIFVISTPLLPFKMTHAASTSSVPVSIAQAKVVYNNHKYDMSPFIFTQGGHLSKVLFPALPGDTNPKLTVQPGNTVSFEFSNQPKKIDAFITDYDGDIPSVYPLKKVGASAFEISGPLGIWQIEVHAMFPNNRYTSFTTLANVQGNFKSESLAPVCGTQNRLQIAGVMDSNNGDSNTLVKTLNNRNNTNNNPHAKWSATGKSSWVQLDLGKEKSICNLEIGFANGDKTINFFTVQTSTDGVHFVSHGSTQNTGMNSGREKFTFPDSPVTARFVKLIFYGNTMGDTYKINDLKVIGS